MFFTHPACPCPSAAPRYYVAEGVRRYAQDTWRIVMGEGGRAAVARHVGAVVGHYTAQSRANNHAVREAACACIAELLEKVGGRRDVFGGGGRGISACWACRRTRHHKEGLQAAYNAVASVSPRQQLSGATLDPSTIRPTPHRTTDPAPTGLLTCTQVDRAAVSPHVPALLRSLVVCFKDMSWPVRDAACIAAGR